MVSFSELKSEASHAKPIEPVLLGTNGYYKAPSFSLIIPVYNEADIVAENLRILDRFLERDEYELIICDDCSKDGTYDQLRAFAKCSKNPNVLLMRSDGRIGKGGTIKRAVREARGETVIVMDVDLSSDLRYVPEMIRQARISGGIVVGQRSTSDRATHGPLRVILSLGYNTLARLLFQTGIKDHQCGFKAMNADVARKLVGKAKNDGYAFDTELIFLALRSNIPVRQVQIRWIDGRTRKSNLRWIRTGFTMMKDLINIRRNYALHSD
jgi:glycosyltransferase involved in cell wall biosynthesis